MRLLCIFELIIIKIKNMGLFDKLRNELIDIIEWVDSSQDTIIWKFPRYENEIKNGAQLTVRGISSCNITQ